MFFEFVAAGFVPPSCSALQPRHRVQHGRSHQGMVSHGYVACVRHGHVKQRRCCGGRPTARTRRRRHHNRVRWHGHPRAGGIHDRGRPAAILAKVILYVARWQGDWGTATTQGRQPVVIPRLRCVQPNPCGHPFSVQAVNYTSACAALAKLQVETADGDVGEVNRAAHPKFRSVDEQLLLHKSVIDMEDKIAVRTSTGSGVTCAWTYVALALTVHYHLLHDVEVVIRCKPSVVC